MLERMAEEVGRIAAALTAARPVPRSMWTGTDGNAYITTLYGSFGLRVEAMATPDGLVVHLIDGSRGVTLLDALIPWATY